jgi:hypothetical protein
MSLTHRGVNYDVGTNYDPGGTLTRPVWDLDLVRQEIRAIRDELHCTSLGIYGTGSWRPRRPRWRTAWPCGSSRD